LLIAGGSPEGKRLSSSIRGNQLVKRQQSLADNTVKIKDESSFQKYVVTV
jgi:hypothetical protein